MTVTIDDLVRSNAHRQRALLEEAVRDRFRERAPIEQRYSFGFWESDVDLDADDLEALIEAVEDVGGRMRHTGNNRPVFGRGRTSSYARRYPRPVVERVVDILREALEGADA